jgi:hypothetical protein
VAFAAHDLFAGAIGKCIATAISRADDIALLVLCAMVTYWHSFLRESGKPQGEKQQRQYTPEAQSRFGHVRPLCFVGFHPKRNLVQQQGYARAGEYF